MPTIYNTQELLFASTQRIARAVARLREATATTFFSDGFVLFEGVHSPDAARETIERLIAEVAYPLFSVHRQFEGRIQLAKADEIPVCRDSVETSFQGLHFDMGQPILSSEPQFFVNIVGLYRPQGTQGSGVKTRVLPLKGLFASNKWGGANEIERKLLAYVEKYGDGWANTNTRRLSCFARVLDALTDGAALAGYRDKTMAEWFAAEEGEPGETRLAREHSFYADRGLNIARLEKQVELKPGELLILDNTRAAHGRIGRRNEREIYQFMYGVPDAREGEISTFRKELVQLLKA